MTQRAYHEVRFRDLDEDEVDEVMEFLDRMEAPWSPDKRLEARESLLWGYRTTIRLPPHMAREAMEIKLRWG